MVCSRQKKEVELIPAAHIAVIAGLLRPGFDPGEAAIAAAVAAALPRVSLVALESILTQIALVFQVVH